MNLNPADLGDFRQLLVDLAQALAPIANSTSSATTLFLNRRFILPKDLPTALYEKHPVQVLMKLHVVQEEMEKWVGAAEPKEMQVSSSIQKREQEIPEKGSALPIRESSSKTNSTELWTRKEPSISPLVKEAKELVHQVQEAIAKLSSSTSIQQASEAPLRNALKKLKPGLDRIVYAIAEVQKQKSSEKEEKLPEARGLPSLPVPARQQAVMQKLRELRQEKAQPEEVAKEKPVRKAAAAQIPDQEPIKPEAVFKSHKERRLPKQIQENQELQKETQIERSMHSTRSEKQEPGQKNTHSEIKPVALPISPLVFETKKIAVTRKKKKRKGFWFKDEEDAK